MRSNDPNLPYLSRVAEALGDLREHVVFIGGAIAGLLVTDPLSDGVRATRDVDAIVNAGRATFHRIEAQVARSGFVRDVESDVICRWVHRESGVLFDLMPVQSDVLGFSNRWYPYAIATAEQIELTSGFRIRMISAAAFVATKMEAFIGRGGGDFLSSHDVEDVLNIVDGRPELVAEMAAAPIDLRKFVAENIRRLLSDSNFANVLPGLIADPDRTDTVMQRLIAMS
jgi:hypothetical protein